jgi:ABC-type multidrug transport system fused ATPase/permease subunit
LRDSINWILKGDTRVQLVGNFLAAELCNVFVSDQKPPLGWPMKGMIHFDHTTLKYSPTDPPVLKDLEFIIEPAQKVCIYVIEFLLC